MKTMGSVSEKRRLKGYFVHHGWQYAKTEKLEQPAITGLPHLLKLFEGTEFYILSSRMSLVIVILKLSSVSICLVCCKSVSDMLCQRMSSVLEPADFANFSTAYTERWESVFMECAAPGSSPSILQKRRLEGAETNKCDSTKRKKYGTNSNGTFGGPCP